MIYSRYQRLYTKHLLWCFLEICSFCFYRVLKFIAYNDEKRRNQGHIQKPCSLSDGVLCIFLLLLIAAKSSILNMAALLDLSLKTLPCMKTSRVLWENQSFWNVGYLYQYLLCFSVTFCSMVKYFWSAF